MGSDEELRFRNGSAETLRIDSGGNIGINTDDPTSRFDVHINDNAGVNFINSGNNAMIDFRSNQVESAGRIRVDESSGGGFMDFYNKNTSGTLSKKMSISPAGRVNIGQASDTDHMLCVADSSGVTDLTAGCAVGLQLQNKSTTDNLSLIHI